MAVIETSQSLSSDYANSICVLYKVAAPDDLSSAARLQHKIRVLDALGCALGAFGAEPLRRIRVLTEDLGGAKHCTLLGGRKTAPARAAFYHSALICYLDFNDRDLAKGKTCHPSDNRGAALAAGEYANQSGRGLPTALGIAYPAQCRLSDIAPGQGFALDMSISQPGKYPLVDRNMYNMMQGAVGVFNVTP